MCGRYTLVLDWHTLVELWRLHPIEELPVPLPRFNVCPTEDVPVFVAASDGLDARVMRWGGIQPWLWKKRMKSDPSRRYDPWKGPPTINARKEKLGSSHWQKAFLERRCLVPATGFYEWRRVAGKRAKGTPPLHLTAPDGEPFTFAGLWTSFKRGDEHVPCVSIITTDPGERVGAIHDREPVRIARANHAAWLSPEASSADLLELLQPTESWELAEASAKVNKAGYDEADCLDGVDE